MSYIDGFIRGMLIGIVIGLICGFFIGLICWNGDIRKDAIKHGAGEYYVDENHNKQFRWKK